MDNKFQVIIIGAGAAGLMCAITAAKRGKTVLIIDHSNKIGKKILMSGGGRCNFTNYSIEAENFLCTNPYFCKSALSRYNQWQFIALVEQYEIEYYDKGHGQLFCKQSSKQIRDLLQNECDLNQVTIKLNTTINSIIHNQEKALFELQTEHQQLECDSLVVATGGLSIPTMGASDFGYNIAKQFSHTILSTRPSLTPLIFDKKWLTKTNQLPGNAIEVTVNCNGQSFTDPMLFTHKGLSGPAILQISNYWSPGNPLSINLLPDLDVKDWIINNKKNRPDIQLKTLLSSQFSQSVSEFICAQLDLNPKLKQIEINEIDQITQFLTNWTIYPTGYEGYRVAEVTFGGVDTDDVSSKTFESTKQKGLYFIGEVLDVTGHLGGYNFQWAWSSGHAAGSFV